MASRHVATNFPEQIKESRKKIGDSFKVSHEALQIRETILLSRVDEIEKEYNSKTEKMNKLIESLNKVNSLCVDTLTNNELKDTHDEVITSINRKVLQLTADTDTSIVFVWDNFFETDIERLGSINLTIGLLCLTPAPSLLMLRPLYRTTRLYNCLLHTAVRDHLVRDLQEN